MVLQDCLCPTMSVCPHNQDWPKHPCNVCFWSEQNMRAVVDRIQKASVFHDYSRLRYVHNDIGEKSMSVKSKTEDKKVVQQSGFKNSKTEKVATNLWKQKGEDEKAFYIRMSGVGFDSLEKADKHWDSNQMVLHPGTDAAKCVYCKRLSKKASSGKTEVPKPKAEEPKVVEDKVESKQPVEETKSKIETPVTADLIIDFESKGKKKKREDKRKEKHK